MIVLLMPLWWVESSRCAVASDGWLNQKEEDATRTLQQATEVQQLSESEGIAERMCAERVFGEQQPAIAAGRGGSSFLCRQRARVFVVVVCFALTASGGLGARRVSLRASWQATSNIQRLQMVEYSTYT